MARVWSDGHSECTRSSKLPPRDTFFHSPKLHGPAGYKLKRNASLIKQSRPPGTVTSHAHAPIGLSQTEFPPGSFRGPKLSAKGCPLRTLSGRNIKLIKLCQSASYATDVPCTSTIVLVILSLEVV